MTLLKTHNRISISYYSEMIFTYMLCLLRRVSMFAIDKKVIEKMKKKITKKPLVYSYDGEIRPRGCGCEGECRNSCGESCYKTK